MIWPSNIFNSVFQMQIEKKIVEEDNLAKWEKFCYIKTTKLGVKSLSLSLCKISITLQKIFSPLIFASNQRTSQNQNPIFLPSTQEKQTIKSK